MKIHRYLASSKAGPRCSYMALTLSILDSSSRLNEYLQPIRPTCPIFATRHRQKTSLIVPAEKYQGQLFQTKYYGQGSECSN